MNRRIKKIRRDADLTQAAFAARIGMKQNSIALIESGKRNISDQAILSICREFGVNEEWLRTGEGEMYKPMPLGQLDSLARDLGLTHRDYVFLEKLLKNTVLRRAFEDFCLDYASGIIDMPKDTPAAPSGQLDFDTDFDIDAEVEAYRQELILQKKAEAESSASDTPAGTAG